jgi:nonsense-mediated mRNA decay protein 3
LELATICKDDLAILPKALSRQLGGIGPLVLVYKITQFVHIVDVNTMQTFEIDNITYWKNQFKSVCSRDRLTNFIVLEIDEPIQDPNVSRAAAR